jgi:hypothetical protein
MLKICIVGFIIHKKNPSLFLFEREHNHPYTVKVNPKKGLHCDCIDFYKHKTCVHSKIVYNMLYVIHIDPESRLHQQYWDLLKEKGLGNNAQEDFKIKLESLDEVTFEDEKVVIGKYYSRYDGRYILIHINKIKE